MHDWPRFHEDDGFCGQSAVAQSTEESIGVVVIPPLFDDILCFPLLPELMLKSLFRHRCTTFRTRRHFRAPPQQQRRYDDAPASAHVKRTSQESFSPEAFVPLGSMPWSDHNSEGLNFVAFAASFDAFDTQMIRMTGLEGGIVDGVFQYSSPLTGTYYCCPPVKGGRLDLKLIGR